MPTKSGMCGTVLFKHAIRRKRAAHPSWSPSNSGQPTSLPVERCPPPVVKRGRKGILSIKSCYWTTNNLHNICCPLKAGQSFNRTNAVSLSAAATVCSKRGTTQGSYCVPPSSITPVSPLRHTHTARKRQDKPPAITDTETDRLC